MVVREQVELPRKPRASVRLGTAVTAPQLTRRIVSCRSAASAEVALEGGHRGGPRAARWAASKHAKLSSPHEPTLARPPRLSPPHGLQSPSSVGPVGRQRPHVPSLHDPVAQGTAY